ncbi:uncharacterized protein METZ01_LOCUS420509, partial [marine metagenome]
MVFFISNRLAKRRNVGLFFKMPFPTLRTRFVVINKSIPLTGGGPKHGRYVTHKKGTPLCNLFVTMLKNMGIET